MTAPKEASASRYEPLPRGRHRLSREHVADSQRERIKRALIEELARGGYRSLTIAGIVERANVSRATFYEHFADKDECMLAAYDDFAAALVAELAQALAEPVAWDVAIGCVVDTYLGTLDSDIVAARALIVEMEAAGPPARHRQRAGIDAFAGLFARWHRTLAAGRPEHRAFSDVAYRGMVLGIRELIREELDRSDGARPDLPALAPDLREWAIAAIRGARP